MEKGKRVRIPDQDPNCVREDLMRAGLVWGPGRNKGTGGSHNMPTPTRVRPDYTSKFLKSRQA